MPIITNENWDNFTRHCNQNTDGGRMYPNGYCYKIEGECNNSNCPRQVYMTRETFNEAVKRYNDISRASQLLEE